MDYSKSPALPRKLLNVTIASFRTPHEGCVMRRREHRIFLLLGIIALLIFAADPREKTERQAAAGATMETISLGVVSEKPRERIEEYRDFVNYLAQKLSSSSSSRGKVVVARTPHELGRLLQEKKVDFYMESPYPTFLINEQTGGKLLLRRWKRGVGEYRSILFTRRDSGVTRLEDLVGKMIAFEDPGSTSGYFLPKVFLLRKGFTLTEKTSFRANVSPQEIGYVFAHGSEENITNWVLLRRVVAGALSSNDLDELDEKRRAAIAILAETETVPRHLLSVRKDWDPALVNRLREVLLSIHEDDEGRKVLRKADKTTKFDLLPGGEEMMYHKIRELFLLFQGR